MDCIVWSTNMNGMYTLNSACSWFLSEARNLLPNTRWTWIWKLKAPEKIKIFIWKLFHNSHPTNLLRFKRNISSSPICGGCNQEDEDILHCIRDYVFARSIWLGLGLTNRQGFWCSDVVEWVQRFASSDISLSFLSALWWIRRRRNILAFGDEYLGDNW